MKKNSQMMRRRPEAKLPSFATPVVLFLKDDLQDLRLCSNGVVVSVNIVARCSSR